MRDDVVHRIGYSCLARLKAEPTFPYKTGNLMNNATTVEFPIRNQFIIIFDKRVAPYINKLKKHKRHKNFFKVVAVDSVVNTIRKLIHHPSRYKVVSSFGRGFINK